MLKALVIIIYNIISIPVFGIVLPFIALFDRKFRQSLSTRYRLLDDIKQLRKKYPNSRLIWIHSASMGEFEQARPIISQIKQTEPNTIIFATFMSPSGYEARKNYPDCHAVQYIPLDFFWQVSSFYKALKPDAGIIIRYEFWPNLILLASNFNVRLYLVNASLKKNQSYGKWYFKWFFLPVFKSYRLILTVSGIHTERFRSIVGNSVPLLDVGDSRFDQVVMRSQQISPEISNIKDESRLTFVMGSSWTVDWDIWLDHVLDKIKSTKKIRLILVPHEIHPEDFVRLQNKCSDVRLCRYSDGYDSSAEIIWFDVMGKLMQLYSVADFAYVGGGFGVSVHNILEPGVYGIPVCFGPVFSRSPEAVELSAENITTVIHSKNEAGIWLDNMISDSETRLRMGAEVRGYILKYSGVSGKMVRLIHENLTT